TIAAPGVLGNDTDVEGDALTAHVATSPAHGSLTLNPDGSFSYAIARESCSEGAFTYTASDGSFSSSPATVSLSVTCVDDAPVANPDSYTATEDTTLTIAAPGVLANDTDVEGDALTAHVATSPAHGSLTLNPDGSFSY